MLVCFSHLRWDFVWQRPQHLLSRFAQSMEVVVVEEPISGAGGASLRVRHVGSNLVVLTPILPEDEGFPGGFGPQTNPLIRALLSAWIAERRDGQPVRPLHLAEAGTTLLPGTIAAGPEAWQLAIGEPGPIFWYYTPMALGAAPAGVAPALVVYDAMDELAMFRFAPKTLVEQEARLMAEADLVFAGGPSLYRARRDRHPAVHCFPSGVDAAHFSPIGASGNGHPALAGSRRPIAGFYGVIDERIDLDLVAGIAQLRPDWTIALVGPTAKISSQDLPQEPNIRFFGMRPYEELPAFLASFDVALLPFARNPATRFISPTKTLEYLAGGKPVVGTPIADVLDLYGDVVAFAETAPQFVSRIETLLAEPPAQQRVRQERSAVLLAYHSWDRIAQEMLTLMDTAVAAAAPPPVALGPTAPLDELYATGAA